MTDTAINLDDPNTYSRLDPEGMYRLIEDLPLQMERAWAIAGEVALPSDYRSVRSVVIAGMGGSAIGGSLLESYGAGRLPVPLSVWRNYGVPGFVGEDTLLIGISYSGNTEETLSALQAARQRGAKSLVISTGGRIKALAQEWSIPLVTFQYPAQPRATLGYLFTPLVRVFARLGFLDPQDDALNEAVQIVRQTQEQWGGSQPSTTNEAKQLAQESHHRAVVIYGADYLSAVARRWKTQMNENGKNWSFFEEFPELDHNAIVGYEYPKGLSDALQVVMLSGPDLPERVRLRMRVTQEILDGFGGHWRVAEAQGKSRLAQIFSLISLGDYVSYYLALLNGADPTTIEPINFLKDALSREAISAITPL